MAEADPFNLIGTLLDRRHRVDAVVAQGGFGIVYAGRHIGLDTPIAIKVLKIDEAEDDEDWADRLAQFLDEAKTLARLRHPNIVGVLDAGTTHVPDVDAPVPWI